MATKNLDLKTASSSLPHWSSTYCAPSGSLEFSSTLIHPFIRPYFDLESNPLCSAYSINLVFKATSICSFYSISSIYTGLKSFMLSCSDPSAKIASFVTLVYGTNTKAALSHSYFRTSFTNSFFLYVSPKMP